MDFWSQKKLLPRLYKDIGNIPLPHGLYFQISFFPYFSSLRSISGGTSFTNLLRGLASFDALFLTVAIMSFGLPKISPYYFEHIFQHIMVIGIWLHLVICFLILKSSWNLNPLFFIIISVYGLLHTFRVGSVYVTLAVTFERFHAIICPLRHFKWKKYMLPFCICFAVVYNIPKYFELQMVVSNIDIINYIQWQSKSI